MTASFAGPALGARRLAGWTLAAFALFAVASIALQNLIFVTFAAWLVIQAKNRRRAWLSAPFIWPLLLLGASLVLSSLFAGHLNASLFGLRKAGLIVIFVTTAALLEQPAQADRCLDLFILGAAACAAWSIGRHVLALDGGRAISFSGDYMAAGGMYMLALILAAARFLFAAGKARWIWLAAAALLGPALLFTYTRSSWIGALAGLAMLTGLKDWRLPIAGLALGAVLLLAFPHSQVAQRFSTINSKYTSSNVERRYMWDAGLKLFRDRPWLGYGTDNLSRYYGRYAHREAQEQNPPHVHNTLLQLGLNGGVLAVFFFSWWAYAVLAGGFRAWQRLRGRAPERAGAALGLACAFCGFLINGLFEFNFGASQVISIVYFLTGLLAFFVTVDPLQAAVELPRKPRLLFLRPRFRGDVLLASAVPRLIKRDFPDARVDLLAEAASAEAAAGEPAWDEVLVWPKKGFLAWWRMVRRLRGRGYDAVCDLFGNPRSAQMALASGARWRIGPQTRFWGALYHLRTRPDRTGPRPAWEAYLDVLRTLGMKDLSLKPRWVVGAQDERWARDFLRARRLQAGRFIGMFPGGSHPAKRWPLPQFLETGRRLQARFGLKIIFVFGPLESGLKREYVRSGGKLSLCAENLHAGQLAALWSACVLVISNDAFPMHLGPAVGTPTIGLFGPGEPKVWFPYARRQGHRALHAAPACWPCHQDVCLENICWRDLTPDQVAAAAGEILSAGEQRRTPGPGAPAMKAGRHA